MIKGIYIRVIKIAIIAVAMMLIPLELSAEKGKLDIDEKAYLMYVEADKKRYTDEGLKLSQKMYEYAVSIDDKKAQCLAVSIPVYYYSKKRDTEQVKAATDRMRKVAKDTHQMKYYYFAWSKLVEYYINNGAMLAALQDAQALNSEALSENPVDHFAIATSYRTLGNVFWSRLDFDHAAEIYQKALDYYKKYLPNQSSPALYSMLGRYYLKTKNYKKAIALSNDGLKYTKTDRSRGYMYTIIAIAYYNLGEMDSFRKAYKKMSEIEGITGESGGLWSPMVKVMERIANGDMDGARRFANEASDIEVKLNCQKLVSIAENDWKSANDVSEALLDMSLKDFAKIHSKDIAEINKSFEIKKINADNLQLKLNLVTSQNAKERLEKEKILAREKMKDLELTNNLLTLNETRTIDSLNKIKINFQERTLAVQRERVWQEEEAHKLHITIFVLVMTFLLALLANSWINRNRQQHIVNKLRQSNADLEEAKERAEESSKMKSMFVQNVSHEIRTPLNAIVGFTDLILNPNMQLSEAEKAEFGTIIHHNSDLLTSLVNDVLILSELQSGKAKLNITPCKCNEICRSSIETVMHRKPENVSLDFTTDVDDDYTVKTDSRRINQVLINFLTNAEKYTSTGSIVLDCSTKKKPNYVTFSVTDTGCGVPEEKQDLIFGRFEKLDDFHQGMGLGLNICTFIAKLLNAEIGMDKTYTQGSRFYFAIKT